MRQEFLAEGFWAEGPAVRPAQGTALGNGKRQVRVSAQRANESMNGWPVGPTTSFSCTTATPRALPWAGRTMLLRSNLASPANLAAPARKKKGLARRLHIFVASSAAVSPVSRSNAAASSASWAWSRA